MLGAEGIGRQTKRSAVDLGIAFGEPARLSGMLHRSQGSGARLGFSRTAPLGAGARPPARVIV